VLTKGEYIIYQVNVAQQHTPTAVPCNAQTGQHSVWGLTLPYPSDEFLPLVAYQFTARETSYGYYHRANLPQSLRNASKLS